VGKKAQWANSAGEPIACCWVQVHTPARGYECRRATSEQHGDDSSKDIPRSRGCQPYITFSAYGQPPRRRDERKRAFQSHDRIQFGRGLTCSTGRWAGSASTSFLSRQIRPAISPACGVMTMRLRVGA
jgi:hypothetical protein